MVRAVADTADRYGIEPTLFPDFLASMRSDLHVTDYPTYADLRAYMHGSAAVIGLQMLPVLGTVVRREEAAPHAAALGVAFQLTNFLRDVGEDLDRGRVYLPAGPARRSWCGPAAAGVEPPHGPRRPEHPCGPHRRRGHDKRGVPGGGTGHRHTRPSDSPLHPHRLRAVRRHSRRHRGPGSHSAAPPCGGVPDTSRGHGRRRSSTDRGCAVACSHSTRDASSGWLCTPDGRTLG